MASTRGESRAPGERQIVDLREDFQKTHRPADFCGLMRDTGVSRGERRKALVLINRRGYSWSVLCRSCGASVQCVTAAFR